MILDKDCEYNKPRFLPLHTVDTVKWDYKTKLSSEKQLSSPYTIKKLFMWQLRITWGKKTWLFKQ